MFDLDEVAHLDLCRVVDNVLVALQGVSSLLPSTEEATSESEAKASCLDIVDSIVACSCFLLNRLRDIRILYGLAYRDAIALWRHNHLLFEVRAVLAHALDAVVLSAKSIECDIFILIKFKLVSEGNFTKKKELGFVSMGVINTL